MRRVATWAKMIRLRATTQLTTIELLIGKPNRRPISTAFCDGPCSTCPGIAVGPPGSATLAGVVETPSDLAPAANVEPALRPRNAAIKSSVTHRACSLSRIEDDPWRRL